MTEQQGLRTGGATAAGTTNGSSHRDDLPDPSLRSVGEVLGDITSDLSTLMRQEVELAKAEIKQTADNAKAAGGMFAGAGVAGHLALIFFSLALWWALGDLFDNLGWSAVVVGLLWAIAAAVMASIGKKKLQQATPVAPRTVDTAKEIPHALKGQETR
jgi:putative superfamily III holin-X